MSRNTDLRQRDGNWGEIHDRLHAADARRRAELDAVLNREPATCQHCGAVVQARHGTGYCWRGACQNAKRRAEYQRARAAEEART